MTRLFTIFCAPFPYHILNFPVAKTVEESGKEAWKEMNVIFGEIFEKVLVERQNILCSVLQDHFPENHLGRTKYIMYYALLCIIILCTVFKRFSRQFKITLEGREEGGRERPEGEVRDVGLKINII